MKAWSQMQVRLCVPAMGLITLNVLLLIALVGRLAAGSQAEAILAVRAQNIAAPVLAMDVPVQRTDLEVLQSQALFYQSRKFYVPPLVQAEASRPNYRLAGTMMMPKKPLLAMLVHAETGVRIKVSQGEELEGWVVSFVENGRVLLTRDAQEIEIGAAKPDVPMQGMLRAAAPGNVTTLAKNGPTNSSVRGGARVLGNAPRNSVDARPGSPLDSPDNIANMPSGSPRLYIPPREARSP